MEKMDLIISNTSNNNSPTHDHQSSTTTTTTTTTTATTTTQLSRYESQKRRDWNTFGQYLRNHRPPLMLSRCSGAHVLEFLRYLDQFGKTKVHNIPCPFFGHPNPPAPCPCPLRQAWGSLDALVGRLRAAYEELGGGSPESNPFGARAVRLYLREVRDSQAKARGVSYDKKKKKKRPQNSTINTNNSSSNSIMRPFHHHELCHGESSNSHDTGLAMEYYSLDRNMSHVGGSDLNLK